MSIIDDLKRLERVGSESSKATKKLREACVNVSEKILEQIEDLPVGTNLPRNYRKVARKGRFGGQLITRHFLAYVSDNNEYGIEAETIVNGGVEKGYYVADDVMNGNWIQKTPRWLCLQFSRDVATGLLKDISEFLEKRTKEDQEHIEKLENEK